MPTSREVHQFLSGKMNFTRTEGGHSKYALPRKLSRSLPIMLPFHLQHGRGDVANHILKQIEHTLGVSSSELVDAIACNYSDMVLYMSLLATALIRLVDGCTKDPVVYEDLLAAFCDGTPGYIAAVRADCRLKKLRSQEVDMIKRLIAVLGEWQVANRVEPERVRKKTRAAIIALIDAKRTLLDA